TSSGPRLDLSGGAMVPLDRRLLSRPTCSIQSSTLAKQVMPIRTAAVCGVPEETAMYADVQLFIDGAWKKAISGKTMSVLNPATAEPIGTVAHAERADLDAALSAGQKGFQASR